MLIRFIVENIFSFDDRKEFQMFPVKTLKTLKNHIYDIKDLNLLKMASIYGANGSGKSNLLKSIYILQKLVENKKNANDAKDAIFKFHSPNNRKQVLAVEFFEGSNAFYYGLELEDGIVVTEELFLSGLGKTEDTLVYERKTDKNKNTTIKFMEEFENSEKNRMLKELIIAEFVKPEETIIKILSNRENEFFDVVKNAYRWFSESLLILFPESKFSLTDFFAESSPELISELETIIVELNVGIKSITTNKIELMDYLGKNDEKLADQIKKRVDKSEKKYIPINDKNKEGSTCAVIKQNEDYFVIKPVFKHVGKNGKEAIFDLSEESDGTIRVIDLIPVFKIIAENHCTIFIDEIERSLHPNLIKELINGFSLTESTKGQLIFTTHESNLLDQEIFRQDEIWFTEKDQNASTDIYSLSNFKVHKTKDIRKGYLCGRYGSIPFLSNIKDLGWLKNANK